MVVINHPIVADFGGRRAFGVVIVEAGNSWNIRCVICSSYGRAAGGFLDADHEHDIIRAVFDNVGVDLIGTVIV